MTVLQRLATVSLLAALPLAAPALAAEGGEPAPPSPRLEVIYYYLPG